MSPLYGPNLRKQTHAGIMKRNPTQLLPAAPAGTEWEIRMASDDGGRIEVHSNAMEKGKDTWKKGEKQINRMNGVAPAWIQLAKKAKCRDHGKESTQLLPAATGT